jgi:hypothetical protein
MLMVVAACGAGDGGDVDPRCASVCAIETPEIDGAFDVCSGSSAELCADDCTARIADVSSLCAACLLEDACFSTRSCPSEGIDGVCDGETCTVYGRDGECSFDQGDLEAEAECWRQVEPRREVECTADYRDPLDCAAACAEAG